MAADCGEVEEDCGEVEEFKLEDDKQELQAIRQLQDDFNDGEPFDLNEFKPLFMAGSKMGVPKSLIIESKNVVESDDLVELVKYIFLDPEEREEKYNRRRTGAKNDFRLDHTDLIEEIRRLQSELNREKDQTKDLEKEGNKHQENLRMEYYTEFLRAIISDDILSKTHLENLKQYQKEHNILPKDHDQTLVKLKVSNEDWIALVDEAQVAQQTKGRGDTCVFPCMHCISELQASKVTDTCPVCREKFDKMEKIFL